MTSKRIITSPEIIKTMLFQTWMLPGVFASLTALFLILKTLSFTLLDIAFACSTILVFGVIPLLILYWGVGRAFYPVILTEEGIRSGKICLKWDEIILVKTIEVKMYPHKLFKPVIVELICLTKNHKDYSFYKNNTHCILMTKDFTNCENLAKYSKGKSPAINTYLDSLFGKTIMDGSVI